MAEIPNLAGIATKDLVETIGGGNFKASYINWARTMNLIHQHASGWMVDMLQAPDGGHAFRAPDGSGYLMLRWVHVDGTETPALCQAIMDNRNSPIKFEKIHARDVTDTHRRGSCMIAAFVFGLGYELWAKMPLESGYSDSGTDSSEAPVQAQSKPAQPRLSVPTVEDFLEAAKRKGLVPGAAELLLNKVGTNYASGIKTLEAKDPEWIAEQNRAFEAPSAEKTIRSSATKKTPVKPSPDEY